MTVFATVIAITKDLPDVEGDRRYNIDTLATRFGPRAIAFAGTILISFVWVVPATSLAPQQDP